MMVTETHHHFVEQRSSMAARGSVEIFSCKPFFIHI